MGEIARLPLGAFQQQFGPEGKRCWELAQGIDAEPLVPAGGGERTVVRRVGGAGPAGGPGGDPREAWFAVKAAIARRPPERPVEELEVELVGLSGESGKQSTMFEGKGKLWRQGEEAVRRLEVQKTKTAIGRGVAGEAWPRTPGRRSALADFAL